MPRQPEKKQERSGREGQSANRPRTTVSGSASIGPGGRNKIDARVQQAQLAWNQRRFDEAIRLYEQALAKSPNNAVLLVDVARAYALRFRFGDAEKLVGLAERLYPDDAHLQQMLGRSYGMLQQFDRAMACYRRSLELAPVSPERPQMLIELAKMHERLHQLESARQCAEEALERAPGAARPRYVLATIDRRSGRVEQAAAAWRELSTDPQAPPGIAADSLYELASLHDAAGEYEQAFDALIRAKQILNRAAMRYREDAADIARISGKTFANVSAERFSRWAEAAGQLAPLDGPLALLASHPRSGTTLLEQVLDAHPNATSADELQIMTEMVYLPLMHGRERTATVPAILDSLTAEEINGVRRAYYQAMQGALREPIAGRLLVDKNPELTSLLPVIARAFPEMRVVFALRDPRDVVVSCFMQRLPLNAVSVHYLSLEATAKKYAASMRAWLKIRPWIRNPWIEVRYEDTVADLEAQARRALEFLGLSWDERVLEYHRRAREKHVHSPTYEAVTKPVYSGAVGRWRNYARQLEPCLETLEPYVKAFGYS